MFEGGRIEKISFFFNKSNTSIYFSNPSMGFWGFGVLGFCLMFLSILIFDVNLRKVHSVNSVCFMFSSIHLI